MATIETQQKVFGFYLPAGADGELFKQTVLAYLTAAFLASLFLAFVLPRFTDLAGVRLDVSKLETRVNNLNKTLDALDSFRSNVSEQARDSIFLAIPAQFDPGLILVSLRQLAKENQVGLTGYSLAGGKLSDEGAKTTGQPVHHPVKVEIAGVPLNLIGFIESLDKSLPIGSVTNLSISEVSKILFKTSSDSKLAMDVTFYHLPVETGAKTSLEGRFLDLRDLDTIRNVSEYSRLGAAGVPVAPQFKESLFGL